MTRSTVALIIAVCCGLLASACTTAATPLEFDANRDEPITQVTAPVPLPRVEEADAQTEGRNTAVLSEPPILDDEADYTGQVVRILGTNLPGRGNEAFDRALDPLRAATGLEIVFEPTADSVEVLAEQLAAGAPPDIALIPQPGRIQELADTGAAFPLPASIDSVLRRDFDPLWADLASRRGRLFAVPVLASVKSLVWYRPQQFERLGYAEPTTWGELIRLTENARRDGIAPWCIGIASGAATGWPLTDWIEDVVLRQHGPEVYDEWVRHDIPFNDERILRSVDFVARQWFTDGNVLGGRQAITSTPFLDAGLPLLDDDCLLHRQASFYASAYTGAEASLGPDGDVNVFVLPRINGRGNAPVLGSGTFATALTDRAPVYAVMNYLASTEYANARIAQNEGGYLSPNLTQDPTLYDTAFEAGVAQMLVDAPVFRFDASDLMPVDVGAGAFWLRGTAYAAGAIDAEAFLDATEAAWPD